MFGRQTQFLGNFEKTVENFPSENCKKFIILAYISNKLTNNSLIFCSFGREMQIFWNFEKILKFFDENSIEKLNSFYFYFFRKFVS